MRQIRDSAFGVANGTVSDEGPTNPNADLPYSGLGGMHDRVAKGSGQFRILNRHLEIGEDG